MTATIHLDPEDRFRMALRPFGSGQFSCVYIDLVNGTQLPFAFTARTLDAAKSLRDELSAGIASLEAHLAAHVLKEGA